MNASKVNAKMRRALDGLVDELRAPLNLRTLDQSQLAMYALVIMVAHPVSWLLMVILFERPYDNPFVRATFFLSGVLVYFSPRLQLKAGLNAQLVVRAILFANLCVFVPWMYLHNATSYGLVALVGAVLTYFLITDDWRIAAGGVVIGAVLSWWFYASFTPLGSLYGPSISDFSTVIGLGLLTGLILAANEMNRRRIRLKAVTTLVGVMAHELRTPLASLSVASQFIKGELGGGKIADSPKIEVALKTIDVALRQMNSVIDMQIANAKVMNISGRQRPLNVGRQLDMILERYPFKSEAEANSVQVLVHSEINVIASRQLFQQVFTNLIKNALAAVSKTGRTPSVADVVITVSKFGSTGVIEVSDKGCGIDPESKRRVFEPFYSTSPGASHGLGLPFVRQVVNYWKGSIELSSEVGKGTVVRLELPVSDAEESPETIIDTTWA